MEQEQINFTMKLQFVAMENGPVAHSQAWGYTRLVATGRLTGMEFNHQMLATHCGRF